MFGNWACVTNPVTGETRWGYFTAGENRLPVRQHSWRGMTEDLFTSNWSLVTSHPDVLADVRGGSRPPRSVRSALAEQARKRRYNAARKAARQAERAATEPTLFG